MGRPQPSPAFFFISCQPLLHLLEFFLQLRQMLHCSLHAQPFRMRLYGESRTEHAFRHIADDSGTGGIHRIGADMDMSDCTDLTAKGNIMPHNRRPGNSRLSNDQAVRTDFTIVTDMDKVIESALEAVKNEF